jgi:hypothetical protein
MDRRQQPAQRSAGLSDDAPPRPDPPHKKMGLPGMQAAFEPAPPGSLVPFATGLLPSAATNPLLAAATAVLTTAPLATPTKAQDLKMAQGVDVQIGRDRSDRYDRDRRRDDATVGIGPGGITIGPRQRCRMVTTTIERGDRTITRRERRCD